MGPHYSGDLHRRPSVDSVTFMELVGFVEDKTGKVFADDQLAQLSNFNDLAALIRA